MIKNYQTTYVKNEQNETTFDLAIYISKSDKYTRVIIWFNEKDTLVNGVSVKGDGTMSQSDIKEVNKSWGSFIKNHTCEIIKVKILQPHKINLSF